MRFGLLILMAFWLVACGAPQVLTAAPAPVSVFISSPAYLQPELSRITDCATQVSTISLFTTSDPSAQSDLSAPLLKLQLGSVSLAESQAYQIGQLELKIIVNAANPLASLSSEELRVIYTGQQKFWGHNTVSSIQVWSYPSGDDLRSMLEAALPGAPSLTPTANIAPDPQAILQAVAVDPNGIGYLPASWLANLSTADHSQIKSLSLDSILQENLTRSVIVALNEPLTYEMEALLVCVQQAGN